MSAEYLVSFPAKLTYSFLGFKESFKIVLKPKSKSQQAELEKVADDLGKLRTQAVTKHFINSSHTLELLTRYYNQIADLNNVHKELTGVTFTWEDSLEKPSMVKYKAVTASHIRSSQLEFEMACIVYNVAALQTHLAAESFATNTDEELKKAAKFYQSSAGMFEYLSQKDISSLAGSGSTLTPDLTVDVLNAFSAICLAQAQEMFVSKAIKDGMKDAVIGRLSAQGESLFSQALKLMKKEGCKNFIDKYWVQKVSGKVSAFTAISQYYKSKQCAQQKQVGEQIARLRLCEQELKKAKDNLGAIDFLNLYVVDSSKLLADAEKDNNFIYHERIPTADKLEPIEKVNSAKLAKLTPMPSRFPIEGERIFEKVAMPQDQEAEASGDVPTTFKDVINTSLSALGSYLKNYASKK